MRNPAHRDDANQDSDDDALRALGYVPSFRREFSSLSTISFAFNLLAMGPGVAITLDTPLLLGGPSAVIWCWFIGAMNAIPVASSVSEVVSAYPTCGGLYGASARLCPKKYRAKVGWIVGWLNLLGLVTALASSEIGLANMIFAAVPISANSAFEITTSRVVGLSIGLLIIHGLLNSFNTRYLSYFAGPVAFMNLGTIYLIIILLLAMTPRSEMHSASYVFGTEGLINGTGGWNSGVSFLLGLLSVEWSITGYDCLAHISEELRRAAYMGPTAIMVAVVGAGISGWLLNIALILCSGPFADLPGSSGSAFLSIMVLRLGTPLAVAMWVLLAMTSLFGASDIMQGLSRAVYAFSRDRGLPDGGYFGHISSYTHTSLRAVWLTAVVCVFPILLYLVSPIAANAVFSMAAMALDLSYVIPVILRRVFHSHPEVMFKPGPYYMGDGWIGFVVNVWSVLWVFFICVVFSLPTQIPVTVTNMNYASVITVGVIAISGLWYMLGAHRHYHGPPLPRGETGDVSERSISGPSMEEDARQSSSPRVKFVGSSS